MNAWLIILAVGLIVASLHYIRSLAYDYSATEIEGGEKKVGLLGFLSHRFESLFPGVEFRYSEISTTIIMGFTLILLPFRILKNFLGYVMDRCRHLILTTQEKVLSDKEKSPQKTKIEDEIFVERQVKPEVTIGELNRSLLLALFCLVALVVFTAANYQILSIGLPIIWGVEKSITFNLIGKTISLAPIGLLAGLMIFAEFFLGLMAAEYKKQNSYYIRPSIRASALCYFGLILFCLSEVILAVLRTAEMRSGYYAASLQDSFLGIQLTLLPYWTVAVVSFVVPLIAALTFEYSFRYYIWIGSEAILLFSNILGLPLILAEALLRGLQGLVLIVLELLAVPAKVLHQAFRKTMPEESDTLKITPTKALVASKKGG